MDWEKHVGTFAIIGTIIVSILWINTKFNEIEKDVAILKTVMIMKNIMPAELAHYTKENGMEK